ncbi:MAG TPA: phage major capsid protein, partial [Candidatus Paceibacterota bacterium]|nr:phage major capsid protein [Candidatus Paceibacterota bacterium]
GERMNGGNNPHEHRGMNFLKASQRSDSSRVQFDVRAVMTPEAGSLGNTQVKSTFSNVYTQATSSAAFLSAFTVTESENNRTFPFLDRTDRITAQNKAFADALTQQAFVVSGATVDLENYYAHPVWHNNVARDASGEIGAQIFDWSGQDIRRQIASDALWADGSSNNITGLDNLAGVQSLAHDNTLSGWSIIVEAIQALHDKNVNPSNISMIISPGAWGAIQKMAATDNQPLLRPEGLELASMFVTSLIPDDQGVDNNDTTIFVGDLSKVMLYMDGMYTLSASQRYVEYDYNAAVMCMRADLKSYEPDHICKITGVQVAEPTS